MARLFILQLGLLLLSIELPAQQTAYKLTAAEAVKQMPKLTGNRHKVMILGSPHFDLGNNASDWKPKQEVDMRTPARQQEIEEVVRALEKFRPTKICIEWLPSADSLFEKRYRSYVSGQWQLPVGEYYQLGFRLAKKMGHPKLYCVDNKPEQPKSLLEIDNFDKYVAEQGSISKKERLMIDSLNKQFSIYLDSVRFLMSVRNTLLFINSEAVKQGIKRLWLTGLVHAGNNSTYAGADLTGNWYQRNTRIFSNVKKLCTEPEERILIIYGYGHAFILEELFRDSQQFEVVPVSSILK